MSTFLKTFLILLVIVVFGAIVYLLVSDTDFISSGNTNSPLATSSGQPVSGLATSNTAAAAIDAQVVSQEFLTQLLNIRSIKLRDDIFSRPSFISLTDFTIQLIQPGNEGRPNPFAPFGVDAVNMFESQIPFSDDAFGNIDLSSGGFGEAQMFSSPPIIVPQGGSNN